MWLKMVSLMVELKCPEHGFERFRIKIVKRFNMDSNMIMPKFRSRPRPGEISCLWVGRYVSDREIKKYLISYFHEKGLWERILHMKLV